jgi:predicted DNA-binding transcriptional regulator YafY
VPTSKAERLLDLVIALVNARYFRTAGWIRDNVAGYGDAVSDEAFSRMFERDKQELRDMGIPIETQSGGDGYRIRPGDFQLPPMSFTPAEAAALAVASRLWETTQLGDAGSAALRKLRDAAESGAEPDRPVAGLQARVRTSEPAFGDLFAAIRARRAVQFDYRTAAATTPETRSLEPWGMVSYHGAWYVVGQDTVRNAPRTFRLSRITGPVKAVGRAGAVTVPADIDLKERVVSSAEPAETRFALLKVRSGRGAGVRRGGVVLEVAADPDGFDHVQVPMPSLWDVARRVAAQGPDAVVVDPPDLRDAVVGLLRAAAATQGARAGSPAAPGVRSGTPGAPSGTQGASSGTQGASSGTQGAFSGTPEAQR